MEAGSLAAACGEEVEVLAERTSWNTVWALPDGSGRLDVSTMPTRVEVDGGWAELDTELVVDEESEVVTVAAPTFPMELNPGGAAGRGEPLGSIEREGKRLDVWFPLELPVPELSDSQAVYELGAGIRLLVTVSIDGSGFLPVVELADAAAAERFEGMLDAARAEHGGASTGLGIEFVTAVSEGLGLKSGDEGTIEVVDADGEVHFMAAPPVMWDSSGEELPLADTVTEVGVTDRTRSPGPGDAIAMMGVELAGDAIVVSPDEAMIESPETVWPVYLDPSFNGGTAVEWTAVRTGGYTSSLYKWGDISSSMKGQGSGYCTHVASCNVVFKQRLMWEFRGLSTIGDMAGGDITSAKFRVNGVHSYNCTAAKTNLERTSNVTPNTTWSNMSWYGVLGSRTEAHSSSCGNTGFREYIATNGAKWLADNNESQLRLGLKAASEANMNGWKRFRHDATLSINYNRAPSTPASHRLVDPSVSGCVTGSGRPVIASTVPTLSVISKDPDGGNLQTSFEVAVASDASDVRWSSGNRPAVQSGQRTEVKVPSGKLSSGTSYGWRARTYDGSRYGSWSAWCQFTVDTTKPVAPTVTPVTTGVDAVYEEGVERGGKDLVGKFTLSRGSSSDVVEFRYGFNAPTNPNTVVPASNGTAVISFPALTTGPVTLTVVSRDSAGNVSAPTVYAFDVAAPVEDGIWMLDEGEGDVAANVLGGVQDALTVDGAGWGEGPHSLFESREGDRALVFDGVDDAATTGPVVDTTKSFAVSAHVRLDAARMGQGASFTVLGQDGVSGPGFRLQYEASCPGMPEGCWSFGMPDSVSGAGVTTVRSSVPVTGDEWVHLVGAHRVSSGELQLWVCEVGTPEDPAVGEPVRSQVSRAATPWLATGAFTVGRGQDAGAPAGWWPGAVDNVRVFSDEVVAESKIRRLCQGAEATDFGAGHDALDPTEAVGQ